MVAEQIDCLTVRVNRWESRALWWKRARGGLVLTIEGHGVTQTLHTRSLDRARAMVFECMEVAGVVTVPNDVTIIWVEDGT